MSGERLACMAGPLSKAVFKNILMMYMLLAKELGRECIPCRSPPIVVNIKKGTSLLV